MGKYSDFINYYDGKMSDSEVNELLSIISISDFDLKDIEYFIKLAEKLYNKPRCTGLCDLNNLKVASIFYEPSTRTEKSFESAMKSMNCHCISLNQSSSISKGESLRDTVLTMSQYTDIGVLRHPEIGSSKKVCDLMPIINAGDGSGEHPTQTLLDIYTMRKHFGDIRRKKIALIGDLKNGRTVHSLVKALKLYDMNVYFVNPEGLSMPEDLISLGECAALNHIIDKVDILYVTRIQKERFRNEREYNRVKSSYIINKEIMKKASKNCIVMHPFPRNDELSEDFDNDPRALYIQQMKNGLFMRMGILYHYKQVALKILELKQMNFYKDSLRKYGCCI